jgi:chemotaxis protein MotB
MLPRSLTWAVVGVAVPMLFGCSSTELSRENKLLKNQLEVAAKDNAKLSEKAAQLESQVAALQDELKKAKTEERGLGELLNKLNEEKAAREKQVQELRALVRDMAGVSIESRPEGDFIVIQNEILFDLGKVDLNEKAREALDKTVVAYLKQHPDQLIRIDGHTDGVPIQHSPWESNYHLAAMRALSVMKYLASKGIPEKNMYVVGYGPNKPAVQPPKPDAAVAKNRRVEILLVPRGQKTIEQILDSFRK